MLNTLYITSPNAYISKKGENIVISIDGKIAHRIPAHNIEGLVCFGYQGASPKIMAMCAERGIGLSFLTEHGQFLCRVTGRVNGNVLLRKRQYQISENEIFCSELAKAFVIGKLVNSRSVLMRFQREHKELCSLDFFETLDSLDQILFKLDENDYDFVDTIRGLEGGGSKLYFENFDNLILNQKDDFFFHGRNRRPPLDRMNALMSFIYVLLAHDVESALETVGLDPQVGFLHKDRPGRSSLALDLMEELRPYLADRLALSLINTKALKAKDFLEKENGTVLLQPESKKIVLQAWQKRKNIIIEHPFLGDKIEVGLIPYVQSLLLARTIRGDMKQYPVFISR